MEITAEQKSLLETQFPPEIEKLAEAQLASEEAVEALRAYGASMAEEMLMSYVDGSEELQKTASENKTAISEKVEASLQQLGANSFETESELTEEELGEVLHKEAQAAGLLIAEGYFGEINAALEENPELVEAAKAGFMKKMVAKAQGHVAAGKKAVGAKYKAVMQSKHVKAAKKHVGAHKGKYMAAGAVAAGAAAAHGAHKAMDKK
jgi:hypothetical protein